MIPLPSGLAHLLVLLLCVLAFGALALAMVRHQEDLFGRELPPGTTRALRASGWLLLALALWLSLARFDEGLGWVVYSGHTSAGAGLVFLALLLYQHHQERRRQRGRGAAGHKR